MKIFAILMAAIAVAWSALAADVIAETTRSGDSALTLFGRPLVETTPTVTALTLALLGLSVGVFLTAVFSSIIQGRRIRARRTELEQRNEQRSVELAGLAAKNDLLSWRINELQQQADELLVKRDELLDELGQVSAWTKELRTKARKSKETLSRLNQPLVVVPEVDPAVDEPTNSDR